jgi:outer membrane receptor for ferrienterochelin and colicin
MIVKQFIYSLLRKKLTWLLFMFAPMVGYSQAADSVDLYSLSLEQLLQTEVITASKTSEDVTEAGAVISVVSAKEIDGYGANSLFEVLDRVTSIYALSSYQYSNNLIAMRGNGNNTAFTTDILILLDGRPIRESLSSGNNYPIYNAFPVDRIERIEVIRGPGSVLYGSSAYTGVINIITKSGNKNTTNAMARSGSFNTFQGTMSGVKNLGQVQIAGGANFLDSKGWDYTTRGELDYIRNKANTADSVLLDPKTVKFKERAFGADLAIKYKDFKLSTAYMYASIPAISVNARWGGSATPLNPGPLEYTPHNGRFFADLGYKHEFSKILTSSINLTHNRMYNMLGRPSLASDKYISQANDLLVEVTNYIKPIEGMNIVFGGLSNIQSGRMDEYSRQQVPGGGPHDYAPYNIYDPTLPLNPNPLQTVSPYNTTWWSAYLQSDYRIGKSVKIIAGAQANKIPNVDWHLSPRLGTIVNMTKNFGAKLLYGEAFRAPSAFDKGVNAPPVLIGNPVTKPETIKTLDVQFFYSSSGSQLFLTYFNSKQEDRIQRTLASENPVLVNGNTAYIPLVTNRGTLKSQGIELEGKAVLSNIFSVTGSATYQTTEDDTGKKDGLGMPKTMVKLGLNYTSPIGLSASVFNSYFGEGGDATVSTTHMLNPAPKAYNYLSLNAQYDLSKLSKASKFPRMFLGVYGTNLLDEKIYYPEFIRKNMNSIPGRAGRAFYLSLTCKL